jgi:hypothetical protein
MGCLVVKWRLNQNGLGLVRCTVCVLRLVVICMTSRRSSSVLREYLLHVVGLLLVVSKIGKHALVLSHLTLYGPPTFKRIV